MRKSFTTLLALALVPAAAGAQATAAAPTIGVRQTEHHILVPAGSETWRPGPPSLPPGSQMTVIEGDPTRPGLFTIRLRMPDGYRIMPHHHEADEHVTVISGTFVMNPSDTWVEGAGTPLEAGGFAVMPAGTNHSAWTRGETVVQVHAVGPWKLVYVNPAHDPRNQSR